jgi:hypothetical protein
LTTPNWTIRCPALLSVTRKPTNSIYFAIGFDVLLAVKCAGTAGAVFACLSGEEEEEQPTENIARKNHPSRIEFIIAEEIHCHRGDFNGGRNSRS